ncbi:hypothetical protein CL633_02565 [bacterium]|nr:hypothetical protein [bacterium]
MNKKGFTLVELLVVIAIIGILSTVSLVSVGSVRKQAYAAKAKVDINQLMKGIELAYNDGCKGSVPLAGSIPSKGSACSDNTYIAKIPSAPAAQGWSYHFYSKNCTNSEAKYENYCVVARGFKSGDEYQCFNNFCYCFDKGGGADCNQ